MVLGNGLHEMKMEKSDVIFIQFSSAANEVADDDLFSQFLLKNIDRENVCVTDIFRRIADDVCLERYDRRPSCMNGLSKDEHVCLNQMTSCTYKIKIKFFICWLMRLEWSGYMFLEENLNN
jgi:hypothetical protein